ncbi:MAG TPA: helix-turn-helix transcriptional regulator [Micromonosporaceae bacterium]
MTASSIRRFRPPPSLRPYVSWYAAYEMSGGEPGSHRGLPSPDMTMIVAVGAPLRVAAHPDPTDPPSDYDTLIGGLHTKPNLIAHDGSWAGIQIALRPLGARALFGLPGGELSHHDHTGTDILGGLATELHERVGEAATWGERIHLVAEALMARLDHDRTVRPEVAEAWRRIVASHGGAAIGTLAGEIGWSERHLNNQFRIETGLTPKALARVARFQLACRLIGRGQRSLSMVAADAGYYDQAHLARDFRDIAGCPPSQWIAEEFRNVQAGPMDLRGD